MPGFVLSFLAAVCVFGRPRTDTSFEVPALRQQVAVGERKRTTSVSALRARAHTHVGRNVISGSVGQPAGNLGGFIQDDTFVWPDEVSE